MLEERLKVLFISSWYPDRERPTLGNFVQKHAESVSLYADVTALHVCFNKTLKKPEITTETIRNVNTIVIYLNKPFSSVQKFFHYLNAYKKGLELITEKYGKPDIIHANQVFPVGIVFLFLKNFKRIPFVFTENWTGFLRKDISEFGFFKRYLIKRIIRRASYAMPVSIDLENAMKKLGFNGNYKVIPNVVDTALFKPSDKDISAVKNILHVSTFADEHKNVSGMLRVIKKISEKRQDFTLHFISDGIQEPFIRQAEDLALHNKYVFFHGEKSTEQVAEMMKRSDFLLMFSNFENLPCVIVEAFAAGIPVVSTDVGGIPEHLTEKHGILLKPKDEEALFKAIDKMLDTVETYDKRFLHEYAVNNLSYESVGRKYVDTYYEILNR